MTFGEMIDDVLHQKRMERKDLAKIMDVHPSNVTRYTQILNPTDKLVTRIQTALSIEIIRYGDSEYMWVARSEQKDESNVSEPSTPKYGNKAIDYIEQAKAHVKKKLHDAIVEACMQVPEPHRAEVFRYFLRFQDDSGL